MSGLFGSTIIKGNRITDFTQTTSTVGTVIPWGFGRFVSSGNVIWAALPPKEHVTRKRQGKGGVKQETYTYTMSYAVAFAKEITGYSWIKRQGKVVYTTDPNAPVEDKDYSTKWLQKATLYTGTRTQLPDSTIESYVGSGKVSAFRGLAYIVLEDDNVTENGGAVPTYEACVEVMKADTTSYRTSAEYPIPVIGPLQISFASPSVGMYQSGNRNFCIWRGKLVYPNVYGTQGGSQIDLATGVRTAFTNPRAVFWQCAHAHGDILALSTMGSNSIIISIYDGTNPVVTVQATHPYDSLTGGSSKIVYHKGEWHVFSVGSNGSLRGIWWSKTSDIYNWPPCTLIPRSSGTAIDNPVEVFSTGETLILVVSGLPSSGNNVRTSIRMYDGGVWSEIYDSGLYDEINYFPARIYGFGNKLLINSPVTPRPTPGAGTSILSTDYGRTWSSPVSHPGTLGAGIYRESDGKFYFDYVGSGTAPIRCWSIDESLVFKRDQFFRNQTSAVSNLGAVKVPGSNLQYIAAGISFFTKTGEEFSAS